jgi:SAM-dependent methyltransferase
MVTEGSEMKPEQSDRPSRDRALFDSIAESYVRKDLLAAHREARRQRLWQTIGYLHLSPEHEIIELGCGAGFAAEYLKGEYRHYVGVDHSEQLIDFARKHNTTESAEFFVGDITDLSLQNKFDRAFVIGVLHHVGDPVEALLKIRAVLKPGALFAVNEPSRANPLVQTARWVRTLSSRDYSDEQIQYRAKDLRGQLIDAGFVDCRLFGQGLLSTPFAEVAMPLQAIMHPLSRCACAVDRIFEESLPGLARSLAWNLICVGRNPG